MQKLQLTISSGAKLALNTLLSRCGLDDPVATVFWARDAEGRDLGWMGGAYSRGDLAGEPIVQIGDVELYIEEDRWPQFEGKTLDFRKGKFWVEQGETGTDPE